MQNRIRPCRPSRAGRPSGPLSLLALLLAGAGAATGARSADLQVRNLVPKFALFYQHAREQRLDEAARWELWQKEYGIAAVPPTPEGRALARAQLNSAWSRYATLVSKVDRLEEKAERDARELLPRVESLINPQAVQNTIQLVLFVGQFDGNEYTAPPGQPGSMPMIVMPIETPNIRYALTQELMHAVQINVDHLQNGFSAPLGETILTVGLAMRGTERILPGAPASLYTWRSAEWLARCRTNAPRILEAIRPYLSQSDANNTSRFTYGTGATGLESEAYCAGWLIVGNLVHDGFGFPSMASIPEAGMPAFVDERIGTMLTREANPDKGSQVGHPLQN